MEPAITPVRKQTLPDNLAQRIREFIITYEYQPGDRLPATATLARQFGVGQPTLREAIKKLETIGIVRVKHGSGLYVGENINNLFLLNPITLEEKLSHQHLLDLINARIIIEIQTVALAVENATEAQLREMEEYLEEAGNHLDEETTLLYANMGFHQHIALASGNSVLYQILTLITRLFKKEQLMILQIFKAREKDHQQHREIFEAIRTRDKALAVKKMKAHLAGVRGAILAWNPEEPQK